MNDTMNQNPTPNEPQQTNGGVGPVIGIIIVVIVLILGGLYYWGSYLEEQDERNMTPEQIMSEPDKTTLDLSTQGTSDTTSSIEEDLGATNLDSLIPELNQIDTELGI